MKKEIVLTGAILTVALLYGCGEADSGRVTLPEAEIIEDSANAGQTDVINNEEGSVAGQPEQEENGQQAEAMETDFSFADIADRTFYFSSGAGAWFTELRINDDGSFSGIYQDADMGDTGEDYPNGTLYYCGFSGIFDEPVKTDEYIYKVKLVSMEYEEEPGKEEVINGVRNIYSAAYGIVGGDEFYLYLPGIQLSDLPESYIGWVHGYNSESVNGTTLPYYGLYNINTGDGFSSYVYEEQTLSDRIAMEISFAQEQSAELEEKLSESTAQIEMNGAAEELFQTWDDTLNIIWKLLEANLSNEDMEALRTEEREWIAAKDADVKAAGLEYEGGSMQSTAEALKAAEITKERVYELAEKYKE